MRDDRALRAANLRGVVEGLEDRVLMAVDTWTPLTGGIWEQGTNWSLGHAPAAGDDAVIFPTDANGNPIGGGTVTFNDPTDAANSITLSPTFALQFNAPTFALGAGQTILNGTGTNITIVSGATVAVAPNASFTLIGSTIADNGTLNFGAGDSVGLESKNAAATITVGNGGVLSANTPVGNTPAAATGVTFSTLPVPNVTPTPPTFITINSGGHLVGQNNGFGDSVTTINTGAILNTGDLIGNNFSGTDLVLPIVDVPLVTNNTGFGLVDLLGGTLSTGNTVALTAMGTSQKVREYRFNGSYTINPGATLNVDPNLFLYNLNNSLTVNGALNLGSGDSVELFNTNYVVNGQMTTTNSMFYNDPGTLPPQSLPASGATSLVVNAGGHLIGSGNSFGFTRTTLNTGAVLNGGDLTNNNFNVTFQPKNPVGAPATVSILQLPLIDIPLVTNNVSFSEVDILPSELTTGQSVALTAMGTAGSPNLLYVLVGNSTIDAGATLTVNPGLKVTDNGYTLADNGTLTFGANDLFTFNAMGSSIVVGNGTANVGSMTATSAVFVNTPGVGGTSIVVNSGGHFTGTGNNIAPTTTTLNNGVVLKSGDLTGNNFANTIFALPVNDVPLVTNNTQFAEVDLLAGTLAAGTNLTLTAMGTTSTITLFYVFAGPLTIAGPDTTTPTTVPAATLTINPRLNVTNRTTVTVNGTLNVSSGDAVSLNGGVFSVGGGGTMNVAEAAIANLAGSTTSAILDNAGGTLNIIGSSIAPTTLTLSPNSTASITISTLATVLTIDSTTKETITGDNLAMIGMNGAVATGDPNATIQLGGNYWGTKDPAVIQNMILDHNDDATRPLINPNTIVGGVAGVSAGNVSVGYSGSAQNVTLAAAVTGVSGTINEGTVTFSVYAGSTLIGTAKTANVAGGLATVSYALPGGTAQGVYIIQAQYNGTSNYLPAIDTSHNLTVTRASSTVGVPTTPVTITYNANTAQTANLTATVTSTAGNVNEGTATFTVLNGTTVIGTPVTVNVSNGVANAPYSIPAGTKGGTYSVSVVFNASTNYTTSSNATAQLIIRAAATTTTGAAATATFATASQPIPVSATVTSPAGTVNEGAVTFTLLNGTTVVGTAVAVNVVNGVASGTYTVPAGTPAGTYSLVAAYGGTVDYAASSDATRSLTIAKATTTTTATSVSAPYSTAPENVALTANVASGSNTVNEGAVKFTLFEGTTAVGSPVTGNVANGVATVSYALPAGVPVGTKLTIEADFQGSTDYSASSSTAGGGTTGGTSTVTIVQATPTVAGSTDPGVYDPTTESIGVHATVLSGTTGVNEGTVTFQALDGTTPVGSSVTVNVTNGAANGTLVLPGGTAVGTTDTVQITYNGTADYATATTSAAISLTKATPTVTWPAPAQITYGTPLSATQLDATASVAGSFVYTPAIGTLLSAGANQILSVTFNPTDATDYNPVTTTTQLTVVPAQANLANLTASQTSQFGQATITLGGSVAAGSTIPAGSTVVITVFSATAHSQVTALVGTNGTFSATVPVASLPVGAYTIVYDLLSSLDYIGASNNGTRLTVVPASQAITTFNPPASAVFGQTFHVNVASASGLPVTLTATNAIVVASPLGGYDVTLTSGTNSAVLTASQPGNGNFNAAPVATRVVTAVKAQAAVVLPDLGIFYDGMAHPVSASTNPAGLAVNVTYTLDGVPTGVPNAAGAYVATATVNDPNYQGTATSRVVIVAPAVATTPVVGPVALEYVQIPTRSKAGITSIALTFSGALNASTAVALGNYRLATAGRGGSYDANNAATIGIRSATYNAATHTVTLTVRKAFNLNKPVQLRVYGLPGHAVTDVYGNPIDGTHRGIAGGNENAILSKNGITT